jgi:hypothetical protein
VRSSHVVGRCGALDEQILVSCAGLVPVWFAGRTNRAGPVAGPGSVPGVEGPVGRGEVDSLGNRFDADGQRAVKTELRTLLS